MKPQLLINIDKIKHNTLMLTSVAHKYDIGVAAITKGVCGNVEVAKVMIESGADMLADSRIENLEKIYHLPIEKMLLRLPKLSEVEATVAYADYSLNTEIKVIEALSKAAIKQNKIHKVILMIDVGDLREGIWYKNQSLIDGTIESTINLPGIELHGIGTNLTCFGGVIPDVNNYTYLVELAKYIRDKYKIDLPMISGGNSSSILMLNEGKIPNGINNLRINQSLLLGQEMVKGEYIDGWQKDIISLKAEIIEIQTKPSLPVGTIAAQNAFGKPKPLKDKGIRKRAILAVGRQDLLIDGLKPIDSNLEIDGASSDHLIIDITNSDKNYSVGDFMEFNVVTYASILSAMDSTYIEKVCIYETVPRN